MADWKVWGKQWVGEEAFEISSKNTINDDVIGRRDTMATMNGEVAGVVVLVDRHAGEIIDG